MNETKILARVPDNFKRDVVACINKALTDDMQRYLAEFQPNTRNGIPHSIADWINTNICNLMTSGTVDVIEFPRYSWKGKVIVDRGNKATYTILHEKRLKQIVRQVRKKDRTRPHYVETLLNTINKGLEPESKQLTLDYYSPGEYRFDEETFEEDLRSIFSGSLGERNGYVHCIIAYETIKTALSNIALIVLDKNFEVVGTQDLRELIRPDFADLTRDNIENEQQVDAENKSSRGLIRLKNSNPADTAHSPVALPAIAEQQA